MLAFIREFKAFAVRGNVIDLAVAVVIGGAFGKIVTSLVDNIVTPFIGVILGGVDFTQFAFTVGAATITYGKFIQSIVDFALIAFVIFLAIKGISILKTKEEENPTPQEPSEEIILLREIRDSLRK
jgi:large conductance mechanosensitive channel